MGHNQSSISHKKSYYSVEYLNADFEQELNKIVKNEEICLDKKSSLSRSKSFVKPENRVLPPLFEKKLLRKTNLLKTDGSRKTWRNNSKLKKSNSTFLSSDSAKPGLIRTWLNKSVQNLSRDCDLSSLDSLDQDVNLIDNSKLAKEPQIRVISQFPIDSKVYRHYISGKNVDKLNRPVEVSTIIHPTYPKDYLEPTYDSIHDFKCKKSSSSISLNYSSTFSSITKSSDLLYGESSQRYELDSLDSSIFSALTSSSLINSSNSMYQKKKYIDVEKPFYKNDYNNNFNHYNNEPYSDMELNLSSKSNDYDFLSNAKSGIKMTKELTKSVSKESINFKKEFQRLNNKFQEEIHKVYKERTERFDQAKKILKVKADDFFEPDSKKCLSIKGIDIQSKIRAIEENIIKQELKLSKPSAFKKIEPKKIPIRIENPKKEIPTFYLCRSNDEQQEQEAKMKISSKENLNKKIKFIEIVDCKQQKFKFIPENEVAKDSVFVTPPPPPGYKDDYGYLSEPSEKPRIINNNFILKPKNCDYKQASKDFIPGVILVESQNSSKQASKNIQRSLSKSRRKGLDEVFPDIKLKNHEYESIIKTSNHWYPASDLNDFDDSDYGSNYFVSDNPNYLFNSKKELLKKSFYLDNLRSERNELELSQIFEQARLTSHYSHHVDDSDILNSIENFYY